MIPDAYSPEPVVRGYNEPATALLTVLHAKSSQAETELACQGMTDVTPNFQTHQFSHTLMLTKQSPLNGYRFPALYCTKV